MRMTIALRVAGALLLLAAASVARGEAGLARTEADAWQQLVTLRYDAAAAAEPPTGVLASALGDVMQAGRRHALVGYWLGRYGELIERSSGSTDPDVLFIAANAAYRSARRAGAIGPEGAKQLDPVLQGYANVLKAAPRHTDAAFNFEYVARLRSYLERMKPGPAVQGDDERRGAGPIQTTDLPRGPTVHGIPGGPPVNVKIEEFEILIPRESGEEEAPPGEAQGGRLRRKG
jgi:hypothetical protein